MAFEDTLKDLEEMGCNAADEIRENIRESRNGKLKAILWDAKTFILGTAIGGIGRLTGHPELIGIPPAIDVLSGSGFPSHSSRAIKRSLLSYVKYAAGAALPYVDIIYEAIADKF